MQRALYGQTKGKSVMKRSSVKEVGAVERVALDGASDQKAPLLSPRANRQATIISSHKWNLRSCGFQMNRPDAQRWLDALAAYRYPVARARAMGFGARVNASPPWFRFELEVGDREETMRFEERFRSHGREATETWFEVIFWKLASTGSVGDSRAARIIHDLQEFDPSAEKMWSACAEFVTTGSRRSFESLQSELFIVSGGISVAGTFPAFMRPERYPMVDRWIGNWVVDYREAYDRDAAAGLVAPSASFTERRKTTLTVSGDWNFYDCWVQWCREAAIVLTEATAFEWRARDVEMAAFQNKRSDSPLLPAVRIR